MRSYVKSHSRTSAETKNLGGLGAFLGDKDFDFKKSVPPPRNQVLVMTQGRVK